MRMLNYRNTAVRSEIASHETSTEPLVSWGVTGSVPEVPWDGIYVITILNPFAACVFNVIAVLLTPPQPRIGCAFLA